ncbi:glutathione S-transferase 1-like [Sitodiplosis mosellana]|uniref:glutathione S-transferase 1-like n=1 Tax=Sitodiplosis mosellana TaxID=263140 RepID=UPI002444F2A5|nr:glutathione S-transferase 1-like [Sitodiplosis mosellana]
MFTVTRMSYKLVLYSLDISPPVRAVKVLARLIGLELEIRDLDMFGGEHLKEPFSKINPERIVPTLDDKGFIVWDSHAICMYLADKYAKDDKLYPKDLQLRARCNQRLFFDAASLFVRLRDCSLHIYQGGKEIPQDKIDPIYAAFDILEAFLSSDPFLVGQNLTIADISVAVTILPLEIYAPLKADKHPKILAWLNRVRQTIPFFDEMNVSLTKEYRDMLMGILEKNKQIA